MSIRENAGWATILARPASSIPHDPSVSVRSCGGGGYGPPEERDPERVLRDVLEDKVSAERAREEYRVVIDDRRLDESATDELRRGTA